MKRGCPHTSSRAASYIYETVGCRLLGSCLGIPGREDRALINTDTYSVSNLDDELSFLDILDYPIEATRGHDTIVGAECITLLLQLLLGGNVQ